MAILSTGDEIIPPGEPMRPGLVYDSNARILADAVRELGGEPLALGITGDNADASRAARRGDRAGRGRASFRRDEQGGRRHLLSRRW